MSSWEDDSAFENLVEETLSSDESTNATKIKLKKRKTAKIESEEHDTTDSEATTLKNAVGVSQELALESKSSEMSFLELLDSEVGDETSSLDKQARILLEQEKVFLEGKKKIIDTAYTQGMKKLKKIGNRLKKHNAVQGKGLVAAALLARRLAKLEDRINKLTDNPEIKSELQKLKDSLLEVTGLPRVYLLEPRTLRILTEEMFNPADKNEEAFQKIHKTTLSSMHDHMTETHLTYPNKFILKNIYKHRSEKQTTAPIFEEKQIGNKRSISNKGSNPKRTKISGAAHPSTFRLLTQEMIDRAKKGSVEICDTRGFTVQLVHSRRDYQNQKDTYRYIDLLYDDKNIKNTLRLKMDVHLDGTFKHWAILKEGTRFWMKKVRVWNQVKKQEFGPVTLGILKNTKIYYLEELKQYIPEDMKNWWKNHTDNESSSEEEEFTYD